MLSCPVQRQEKDKVCDVMYCLGFGMQTVRIEKIRLTVKRLDARLGVSSCFGVLSNLVKTSLLTNRSQFPTLR